MYAEAQIMSKSSTHSASERRQSKTTYFKYVAIRTAVIPERPQRSHQKPLLSWGFTRIPVSRNARQLLQHVCCACSRMHLAQQPDRIGHMLEKEALVKLSLRVTKHNTKNIYVDMEIRVHAFLNSAPDGSKWSASCSHRFNPGKSATRIHSLLGRVSPTVAVHAVTKKYCLAPAETRSSISAQPVEQ
jgi:hypothetical protein